MSPAARRRLWLGCLACLGMAGLASCAGSGRPAASEPGVCGVRWQRSPRSIRLHGLLSGESGSRSFRSPVAATD